MSLDDRRIDFFPEALDPEGRAWQVLEVQAIDSAVDLSQAIARVSKARTRAQEQIRLHELAHVGHTDRCTHDSPMAEMICRMLEEVRVDTILYKDSGVDVRNRHDDFDWESLWNQLEKTPFARSMAYLQTWFHNTKNDISPDVRDFNDKAFNAMQVECRRLTAECARSMFEHPTSEHREELVRKLHDFFAPPPPKPPQQPQRYKPEVTQELERQLRQEKEEEAEKAQAAAKADRPRPGQKAPVIAPRSEKEQEEQDALGKARGVGAPPMFGQAEVHDHIARHAKVDNVKAPFTRTGRGLIPEFMEHWLVDRRVFRTEHRGGTLVLDNSGSMRPDFNKIQKQMHSFPNLTVLSYMGTFRRPPSIGRICVHARNGRIDPRFEREPGTIGYNNVDVEALEYGSKFKGPRVWVSDGFARGGNYDDGSYTYNGKLPTKVREVMKLHHYVRVANLDDALAWVNRSRPVVYYLSGELDGTQKDTRRGRRP